ncbi:phage portal protein [Glutamicibacter sp. AOP12-B1-11]|uniref:phage portal protein n=1 Tax=Glutamicibacter sp. AOP12-B1-11 TaxID=3457725 RepID=UPI004033B09B
MTLMMWLDNNLDVDFSTFVETFLWAGDAYAMIIDDDTGPLVTHEDPRECVTFHDPLRQSTLRAAAKFYSDPDEGRAYAVLMIAGSYYDDGLARTYTASMDGVGELSAEFDPESWSWDESSGGGDGAPLKHAFVPVVRLRNRRGMGEFEPHLPHMRRINRFTFQLSVIVMYQAYKQRAIVADVDDPDEEAQGQLAESFNADSLEDVLTSDPGSWFLLPSGAKVWESTQTDVQGLLKAIQDDQLALAAVARRPMGMFAPDNQSASGANFTREGLQFAVEDKQARLRRFLVDVFHLVFLTADDSDRAVKSDINVSFMPAERYTVTDKASATSQVSQKFPLRTILREIWQMTPTEIQQVEAEASGELLLLGEFEPTGAGQTPTVEA